MQLILSFIICPLIGDIFYSVAIKTFVYFLLFEKLNKSYWQRLFRHQNIRQGVYTLALKNTLSA